MKPSIPTFKQDLNIKKRKWNLSSQKEWQLQKSIINYASHDPVLSKVIFGFDSSGKHTLTQNLGRKRRGIRTGTPDLLIAIPSDKYHGLWIELKSDSGKASDAQIEIMNILTKCGYLCKIINNIDDFLKTWSEYKKNVDSEIIKILKKHIDIL